MTNVVSLADFHLTNYKMETLSQPTFEVITGDALAKMKLMASASFDAIIFSPPYNLGWSEKGGRVNKFSHGSWKNARLQNGYATHDDAMPREDYVQWQKDVLTECWRLLADDGAIFYQHKNRVQNGILQTPHDLNPGLPLRQIVVWDREAGGMNHGEGFFTPAHEVIYVFAKPGFKYRKRAASLDVIKLAPAKDGHPAPYPVELPQRFIQALKPTATRILDPFSGHGSTGVAALREGKTYTGIEISAEYADAQRVRLNIEAATIQGADWPPAISLAA